MFDNTNKELAKMAQQEAVVIFSRGHSGTRVLAWILYYLGIKLWSDEDRRSGDVNRDFNRVIKGIAKKNPFITETGDYSSRLRRRLAKAIARHYQTLNKPDRWGWKFPETYLMAPLVYDLFPRGKFIHMVRDGRDVSFKKHLTDDSRRKVGRKILYKLEARQKPRYIQAARSWRFQVDAFDRFKEALPQNQLYEVTFERVCLQPEQVLHELAEFLGLAETEAALNYVRSNINTSKIEQYRQSPLAQVLEVQNEMEPTLSRHGYELLKD